MNADPNFDATAGSLPEVLQADWPRQQVMTLFAELKAGAEVEHVQVRSCGSQGTTDQKVTLDQAETLFAAGDAQAFQIRYRYDGETWCDTILPQTDGAKVIRYRQTQRSIGD